MSKTRRLRNPDGTERPKQARRGISAIRAKDPTVPDPLAPFRFKKGQSGNAGGRSKAVLVSEATKAALGSRDADTGLTRAEILASNLLSRAEVDSSELERVLRITEPELAASMSASTMSVETEDVSVLFKRLGMNE